MVDEEIRGTKSQMSQVSGQIAGLVSKIAVLPNNIVRDHVVPEIETLEKTLETLEKTCIEST